MVLDAFHQSLFLMKSTSSINYSGETFLHCLPHFNPEIQNKARQFRGPKQRLGDLGYYHMVSGAHPRNYKNRGK